LKLTGGPFKLATRKLYVLARLIGIGLPSATSLGETVVDLGSGYLAFLGQGTGLQH